jgi:hypothetical protein
MDNIINNIEYDDKGNIYIKKDDEIYMLSIDRNDDIYFEKIINKIYNEEYNKKNNIKKNTIIETINLHNKTMENIMSEVDDNDLDDFNQEDVEDITKKYKEYKDNPEYKYYNDNSYDDTYDSDCYDDNIINAFDFYNSSLDIKKSELIYEPVYFEFLLLDGDINSSKFIFRTSLKNNQPFYRISLYSDGTIQLNIIGTHIIYYKLNTNTFEVNKKV